MNKLPLVSIIIRTYNNRNSLLKEAIESVINQTYPNIQIVVVEDGSNFAKNMIDDYSKTNTRSFKYHSIDKAGRSVAGNKGLDISDGQYINFLDDDDQLLNNHVEVLMNSILKNRVKAAYSNAYEISTEFISTEPLCYIEHSKDVVYNIDFSRPLLWKQNYLTIQSVLFDKELYLRHGGFDIEMDALEDWSLWMKYSLYNDFQHVDMVTSFYRVPFHKHTANDRVLSIDNYKKQALEKQKSMVITTTVFEILSMIDEINKKTLILYVSKEYIRAIILNHIILRRFYFSFRKFYYKFFLKE